MFIFYTDCHYFCFICGGGRCLLFLILCGDNLLRLYNEYNCIIIHLFSLSSNKAITDWMKNIKVCFHHKNYIYKFKLDLNVLQSANMFNIDIKKINEQFDKTVAELLVTPEQKNILDALSLSFKKQFVAQYELAIKSRKSIDFIGQTVQEKAKYFADSLKNGSSFLKFCKELFIHLNRHQTDDANFNTILCQLDLFQLLYQKLCQFSQNKNHRNKMENYMCFYCLLYNISKIVQWNKIEKQKKLKLIETINKILLLVWQKILNCYEYSSLTAIFQLAHRTWCKCIQNQADFSWIFKIHQDENIEGSTLKFLIDSLKVENKNFKIHSQIMNIILILINKSNGVSELLLLITECINARITLRLENLYEAAFNMKKFNIENCLYLNPPKDLTEDMGKKVIRLKQKLTYTENWQKQLKNGLTHLAKLIEMFQKFKAGKIQINKEKEKSGIAHSQDKFKSQRDRIRKQSYIQMNFEQIKNKYQQLFYTQQKFKPDNSQVMQLTRFFHGKIRQKQKVIEQLEATVASFVDVKSKYVRQSILKLDKKVFDIKDQGKGFTKRMPNISDLPKFISQKKDENTAKEINHINHILPPPPPPPPPFQPSESKSLRGSRNSKDISNLMILPPPPPQLPSLSDISSLPLPPPAPLFDLTPPPLSKAFQKKQSDKNKKDVKVLNWNPVQLSKVKNSFWETVQSVDFDEKQLLVFLQKKEENQKVEAPKIYLAPQKTRKSLLKPDRAKNIQIIIRKTRIALSCLPQAFKQLNEQEVLTENNVDSLINILPTTEEFQIFVNLDIKDTQQWSVADVLFSIVSKIQGYHQILKSLKFKYQFQGIFENYIIKIAEFTQFFIALQKDYFLHSFLSHFLAIGNYMNDETSKGNAYGFKLESIQKSYLMMGVDKKTSLFDYILGLINRKGIKFPQKQYYETKKITPLQVLKQDLNELNKQCRNVQQCLLMSKQDDLRTPQVFLTFYIQCRQKIAQLDTKFHEAHKIFTRACDFYCEKNESEKIILFMNNLRSKMLKYAQANRINIRER